MDNRLQTEISPDGNLPPDNFPPDNLPPNSIVLTTPKTLTKESRKELAMEKARVTDELVFTAMENGLRAVKVKTELVDGCEVMKEEPDHIIRHKFMDSALRAKGYIRPDNFIDNSVNFNLTVEQRKEIGMRLKKILDITAAVTASAVSPVENDDK